MIKPEPNMLAYRIGGLLYTPGVNTKIADKLKNHTYPHLTSLALCLEDSIMDEALPEAEITLYQTLQKIKELPAVSLPLLFVRVHTPQHLAHIHQMYSDVEEVLTGYILPKFDLSNGAEYLELMESINEGREKKLYAIPILETAMIANSSTRVSSLAAVKDLLDRCMDTVLAVSVGSNDLNNLYGLRHGLHQTVYDLSVTRDILSDVLNLYAQDYVMIGPVWEYFGKALENGNDRYFQRELFLDRLNGFTGKTAIHPTQLPYIWESLKVSPEDYEDAADILHWSRTENAVSKSTRSRMNEVKCHTKWAKRILLLAEIYGVAGENRCEIREEEKCV